MADTPFINILTPEQKTLVSRKSLGELRPSYFSAALSKLQEQATRTGDADPAAFEPTVQIGLDLEAALILMPTPTKVALLRFIQGALVTTASPDDLALMVEVEAVRADGYSQVNLDVAGPLLAFDQARGEVLGFLNKISEQQETTDAAQATVIPDLSVLFAALAADHSTLSTTDILAVHDRIADAATLYAFQDAGSERGRELASWVSVLTKYL